MGLARSVHVVLAGVLGMLTCRVLHDRLSSSVCFYASYEEASVDVFTVLLSRICAASDRVCHRIRRLAISSVRTGVCHQWHRLGIAGPLHVPRGLCGY